MKRLGKCVLVLVLLSGWAIAQAGPGGPPPGAGQGMGRGMGRGMGMRGGMMMRGPGPGKWWKNSALVQKLGLSDAQVQQIEKIFQDHRLQLIDLQANLQKAEISLEPLIEADQPNEAQVNAQIDKIAAARAALEKSNAQMMLGIRKVLTVDQWKKLQAAREERPMRYTPGPRGPRGPQPPGQPGQPPQPGTPPSSEL